MLNRVRMVALAVGVMSFFVPMVLFAVPPPAGVNEVVVEMGKFETSYQDGKWEEATISAQEMEKMIKEIFGQAQVDDFVLEEALLELQKYIVAKNPVELEAAYESFQKQYFNYVSHFDHNIHPIMIKIEQHVKRRAPSAYAEKDYAGVLKEMQTAAMLIDHGRVVFVKKGVLEQEVNTYVSKVQVLNLAHEAEDYVKMSEIFANLQETYDGFMEMYKK